MEESKMIREVGRGGGRRGEGGEEVEEGREREGRGKRG